MPIHKTSSIRYMISPSSPCHEYTRTILDMGVLATLYTIEISSQDTHVQDDPGTEFGVSFCATPPNLDWLG